MQRESRVYFFLILALDLITSAKSSADTQELDLLSAAPEWKVSPRVIRCPVHAKIHPAPAESGSGIVFAVADDLRCSRSCRYSTVQTSVHVTGLADFEGLQVEFHGIGMGPWKLRLHDGQAHVKHFVHIVDRPDGPNVILIPFTSFKEERVRYSGISSCTSGQAGCHTLQRGSIYLLEVLMPYSASSRLTLNKVKAIRSFVGSGLAVAVGSDSSSTSDYRPVTGSLPSTTRPGLESASASSTGLAEAESEYWKFYGKSCCSGTDVLPEPGTTASYASTHLPHQSALVLAFLASFWYVVF